MIRLLIYAIALMLLLNVGALLWPDSANYAPHVYSEKKEVNPHFVRLNKEIEERLYSQIGVEVAVISQDDNVGAVPDKLAQVGIENGIACYRVGPFIHQSNYELAQAVLFNAGVEYTKSKRLSKKSSVFRVFLGPYATAAEAADMRIKLKRKKVLDHFVRQQADGYIVSLGIYSTLLSADKAIRLFESTLGSVSKQAESVVLPESYWLHFKVADEGRARDQLRAMDWGETAAKMGLFSCASNS